MRLPSSSLLATASLTTLYYISSLAALIPPSETTPPPTLPPDITFTPNYIPASITVSTDINATCHVILSVTAPNPSQGALDCGYALHRTSYASTSVSTLLIDCLGCDDGPPLSVRGWRVNCPLGRTVSPYETTVTFPASTFFTYACSSTITRTLPLPTPAVTGPPYTPGALIAVSPSGGGACTARLSLAPTAAGQVQEECAGAGPTATVWPGTAATSEVGVDCGGCATLEVRGDRHGCPMIASKGPTATVTAASPATRWSYVCAASATPETVD